MADWYVRNAEVRRLVAGAEAAAEAIDQWETGRDRIVSELPGAFYITPEQQRETDRELQREAAAAAMAVTDAAARVQEVSVSLAWHDDVVRARDRYLDHADAWIARLRQVARDPATLSEPAPGIAETRSASERAFRAAVPPVALYGLSDRVEALFGS
ncbi:MAG TPA: hypothetical protein VK875_11530 [Euzebyales bacterium]|nr:hypothetical protein [Euzebyales bacterium]